MWARLNDVLVALTYPPALSACLLALAALAMLTGRRRSAALLGAAAFAWSALLSMPSVSEALRASLENRHPRMEIERLPRADAVVVLGGGYHYPWIDRPHVDPRTLPYSRLAAGARAFLAGRAPRVILSGGGAQGRTEAETMARAITRFGVPTEALLLDVRSRDTEDNARNTAVIARRHGIRRVLLVTSALHMPRAVRLFEATGLEVVAAPVPEPTSRRDGLGRWLPSFSALWRSGRALKEYLALAEVDWRY